MSSSKKKSEKLLPFPRAGSEVPNAIHAELTIDSEVLLIAFGSMRLNHKVPPFEYNGVLADIPAKKVYVRDPHQYWYQRGLPSIADSIAGVGDHLRSLIDQQSVKRVVTIGGSMGGYAALYFGWYIGANEVHAFAAKTFLSPLKRLIYGDFRRLNGSFGHPLNRKLMSLQTDRQLDKKYWDLKKVLSVGNGKSNYHLYYNKHHRLDRIHSERMLGIPGIELMPYENSGHNVAKDLKESGVLDNIIKGTL